MGLEKPKNVVLCLQQLSDNHSRTTDCSHKQTHNHVTTRHTHLLLREVKLL